MVFTANVLRVLIASPSDTREERDAVEGSLAGWNAARAEPAQTMLLPWRWEMHSVPVLGSTAQSVINSQAVDQADIVIALFDTRLGQQTEAALSGTAEEIERAHNAGKPVHVYFSEEPIPRGADLDQLKALQGFRETLQKIGLLGTYANPADLAYQVRGAIEHDLQQLGLAAPTGIKQPTGAVIRSHYLHEKIPNGFDSKGKQKFTTKSRLVIANRGLAAAEGLTATVATPDGAENFHRWGESGPDRPFDLLPDSSREYIFLPMRQEFVVHSTWTESGKEHTEDQTITTI